jgi:ADP-ribose pyrophosphatase YjhB (NUDIX family)
VLIWIYQLIRVYPYDNSITPHFYQLYRVLRHALKNEDEILLLHVDYDKYGMIWSGVSGYVDKGETEEEAVVRETKEEIGVDVSISDMTRLANFTASNDISFTIFVATKWDGDPSSKEKSRMTFTFYLNHFNAFFFSESKHLFNLALYRKDLAFLRFC